MIVEEKMETYSPLDFPMIREETFGTEMQKIPLRKFLSFTVKVTEHWHRLFREVVESLALEILIIQSWATCSSWPWCEQRLGQGLLHLRLSLLSKLAVGQQWRSKTVCEALCSDCSATFVFVWCYLTVLQFLTSKLMSLHVATLGHLDLTHFSVSLLRASVLHMAFCAWNNGLQLEFFL